MIFPEAYLCGPESRGLVQSFSVFQRSRPAHEVCWLERLTELVFGLQVLRDFKPQDADVAEAQGNKRKWAGNVEEIIDALNQGEGCKIPTLKQKYAANFEDASSQIVGSYIVMLRIASLHLFPASWSLGFT